MTKQTCIVIATFISLIIGSTLYSQAVHSQANVPYSLDVLSDTQVELTWITAPETTYLNVIHFPDHTVPFIGNVQGGITMTLTLDGRLGDAIQVQEYKLVGNQLQLVRFFNTADIPAYTGPTMTPTLPPSTTPVLSVTPTVTQTVTPTIDIPHTKPRMDLAVVLR